MKGLDEERLRLGDIILTTQDHPISKGIRGATKSDISHAMIYVARGSVIDSTGEGVHARNTQRLFFNDHCAVHVRRLATRPGEQMIKCAISFARNQIGTRYSTAEAVRSALGTSRVPTRQQFCSRLVAQSYAWAGCPLVADPAYCTPEELKNSSLLIAVTDAVIQVSDAHVAEITRDFDTNDVMRELTNALLKSARTVNPRIESLRDIDAHLVETVSDDERFARFFTESGYLTAWQAEFQKNPWQYDARQLIAMPGDPTGKRDYCLGVLKDHGEMIQRRDENRVGYTILHQQFGLRCFAQLKTLYQTLVGLQITRRSVALTWLKAFSPSDLSEQVFAGPLEPHSDAWLAALEDQNPVQASIARQIIELSGGRDNCTFCGDPAIGNYRIVGADAHTHAVVTCKLCQDCIRIRRDFHDEEFEPMDAASLSDVRQG